MSKNRHYYINWKTGELTFDGQSKLLEPKLIAVLKLLNEAQGELVTYDEIHQSVWPNIIVAPNALQRIIAELRRHFDDSAKSQSVIKTHPKRGYSLQVKLETFVANVSRKKQLTVRTVRQKYFMSILVCILLCASAFWFKQHTNPPIIEQLKALDTQSKQFSNVVAISQDEFVFYDKQDNAPSIVMHNSTNNIRHTLLENITLYGRIHYHASDNSLRFGEVVFQEQIKCAQIVKFSLVTRQKSILIPCNNKFNHSPFLLEKNNLLFTQTDKNSQSHLMLFDVNTRQQTQIELANDFQVIPYHQSNQFAVEVDQKLYFAELVDNNLEFSPAVYNFKSTSKHPMIWLDNNTLLVADGKLVIWLNNQGVIHQQTLQTTMDIGELAQFNDAVFANISRKNWQPRILDKSDTNSTYDIAPSMFADSSAQFRPESQEISLLSNRSGISQIWLWHDKELQQLTFGDKDISSYLWQSPNNLVFNRNGRLFTLTLTTNKSVEEIPLAESVVVVNIMQSVNNNLLLSIKNKEKDQLVWLNQTTGSINKIYEGELSWAQQASKDKMLINTNGQLQYLVSNQLVPLSTFKDITLQWRYYARDGFVYLQDKQKNIWRYNPNSDSKSIVGQYSSDILFMTDYADKRSQMLSDNLIAEHNELVELLMSKP
ncbi:winged helix-turn-helix domain-containing protein [Thalassotalea marina]|uniref:OmpR/PhoB-type domain-containing protein n=1 Tax=Thalassotalea marina TaxID=1673741 RepID=A0A919BQG2_9GAMM|nr:winged helix-turn-helix domain-containing protein [Thalassotalea marina]GHG03154.1 hypothetical protein GCM10017161_35370 [Thalassotalea marina]